MVVVSELQLRMLPMPCCPSEGTNSHATAESVLSDVVRAQLRAWHPSSSNSLPSAADSESDHQLSVTSRAIQPALLLVASPQPSRSSHQLSIVAWIESLSQANIDDCIPVPILLATLRRLPFFPFTFPKRLLPVYPLPLRKIP